VNDRATLAETLLRAAAAVWWSWGDVVSFAGWCRRFLITVVLRVSRWRDEEADALRAA
jgi:hypothetical protein